MNEITALVTSVGFPIVAYLLLFKYVKEESKAMSEAINVQTEAITALTELIRTQILVNETGDDVNGK